MTNVKFSPCWKVFFLRQTSLSLFLLYFSSDWLKISRTDSKSSCSSNRMSHICPIYIILTGQLCVSSAFHCTEWFYFNEMFKVSEVVHIFDFRDRPWYPAVFLIRQNWIFRVWIFKKIPEFEGMTFSFKEEKVLSKKNEVKIQHYALPFLVPLRIIWHGAAYIV